MSVLSQKTLKKSVKFDGVGLHTGKKVSMTVFPSEPNSGIIFKRIDLKKNNLILPSVYNVSNTVLCTTISNEFGTSISTLEHLMGALYGLGIDNAFIEIDSQEVPIMDGSAKDFVDKFLKAGFEISNVPIKIIKITNKVTVHNGSKFISIDKSNVSLDIDFEIKYSNTLIGNQKNRLNIYESDLSDIFNSRTYCLYEDVEKLREMGLGKGGSLENAIVVKDNKVLNEDGLRNKLEFVNHKILDCMGDLYLLGYRILGKIVCTQGGHKLTNYLLREVLQDNNNFSIIEVREKTVPNTLINRNPLKSIA